MKKSAMIELVDTINNLNIEIEVKEKLMQLISKTITEVFLEAEKIHTEINHQN